jgi:hypothetical protein
MKRKIFIGLAIFAAIWIGYRGYRMSKTLTHSPADTVQFSNKDLNITVTYGRPYKNGRLIFGEAKDRWFLPKGRFWTDGFRLLTGLPRTTGALVPNGQYWRLGANYATEISFSRNILFAGKPVSAGKYRMYSVPGQDTWKVILNSEVGRFGYHEPNYSLDVVTVIVPVETMKTETEQFTIRFENDYSGAKMNFLWDRTIVAVPISRTE